MEQRRGFWTSSRLDNSHHAAVAGPAVSGMGFFGPGLSPRKRGPFHLAPVICFAMVERLAVVDTVGEVADALRQPLPLRENGQGLKTRQGRLQRML